MRDIDYIHHICINSLVPSVKKINIEFGNPGIQVNYWGGLNPPPLILLVTWISNIGFCVPGNQQINANMVNQGKDYPSHKIPINDSLSAYKQA